MTAIRDFLEAVKIDMINAQRSKGITASGRSASSLTIVGSRTRGARLEGIGYWSFLFKDQGRKPGKFPPLDEIIKWVRVRRLQFRNAKGQFMSYRRTAFLVSRKIAESGTDIFQQPSKGVDIESIINTHIEDLGKGVAEEIAFKWVEETNKVIL